MTILLAPMEGLLDFVLRDVLTRVGGIDRCVSEFIRITDQLLPERVFTRIVPELHNGGRTFAGVPVRAQLLGSDPVCLAENAARLASLGPSGIDLNFGCPANVVNRHGGGAALLNEPETIFAIVSAVRRAVPAHMPVSAKMRLGYHDDSRAIECALAIANGASHAINYATEDFVARVKDITAGKGVSVVYDSVGKDTFLKSLDCLSPFGLAASFGNASGKVEAVDLGLLAAKGSLYVSRPTLFTHIATRESTQAMADDLFAMVASGKINIPIDQTFALADVADAHRALESRKTTGCTILTL